MSTGTIENDNWIIEISVHSFLGIFIIIIKSKNKKTGEVIDKIYKTSILNVNKTLDQIVEDLGEYQ